MDGAESRRLELLRKLEAVLGTQEAATLMAHLPPMDWSRLVTTDHLDALRTELGSEISELRSELHTEITQVRSEVSGLRSELHSEIAQVRSEISHVRLDMARWGRTQVYTTIGAVVTTGGLAFAAAGLA